MITQTLALFLDAYRELNARKLFWITLIISALVMGAFALLGVNQNGLTLLTYEFDLPMADLLYRQLFDVVVVGVWLSWGAIILAIVSTAGIFPDLITGGAIDLYLSKPISRLRLFLTKYATGLLFVLLQALIFAVLAFFILGVRAGVWKGSLFLIIPLVVCVFSYVFAISVLVGVMTRSTIAAVLMTVLVWGLFSAITWGEEGLISAKLAAQRQAEVYDRELAFAEQQLAAAEGESRLSMTNPLGIRSGLLRQRRDRLQTRSEEAWERARQWQTAHRVLYIAATILPKSGQTIDILERRLFTDAEAAAALGEAPPDAPPLVGDDSEISRSERARAFHEGNVQGQQLLRERSLVWIIGTSLLFEGVVLALAAWIFCRRDY